MGCDIDDYVVLLVVLLIVLLIVLLVVLLVVLLIVLLVYELELGCCLMRRCKRKR